MTEQLRQVGLKPTRSRRVEVKHVDAKGGDQTAPGATIYAVASGGGKAAICVVRLSGRRCGEVLSRLTRRPVAPREAALRQIWSPSTGTLIDQALVLYFQAPASFTGEDCLELHLHGGRGVVAAVLRELGTLEGLRPAEPGEFTRRALLAGKLDLAEVEGLADLIDSETEQQRAQAVKQFSGGLTGHVALWRERLLEALALVTAEIDFGDEGDVPADLIGTIRAHSAEVLGYVDAALAQQKGAARVRDGISIVLAGPPNAGKSSLLNVLAGREAAIVSEYAGTTRDVIEVALDIAGVPVWLVDTAGLREAEHPAEAEGIARAQARAAQADLVLWLNAADEPRLEPPPKLSTELWRVTTKADLAPGAAQAGEIALSVRSGVGLDALVTRLADYVRERLPQEGVALLTRQRHVQACARASLALRRIVEGGPELAMDLLAADLQQAARALAEVIGLIDVEQVLDDIFSRFCIGK
ncbi:MAG: tRNA uridine-5-carboxymethylaminomethyl(34) synthesis GTPase MnmE [Hyphomicrobiales bacterium]|nr:tRNA uridine-5-carboxymethylaminomethyl(34) synthesis GTPase MnmE [Hyphomicrobiales bacterium]